MSQELKDAMREWIGGLPARVRPFAEQFPPIDEERGEWICYRSTENPRYHYIIISYGEPVDPNAPCTVTLFHGADSTLPGVSTFGQPVSQLIRCNCGKFAMPTSEQVQATDTYLKTAKERVH